MLVSLSERIPLLTSRELDNTTNSNIRIKITKEQKNLIKKNIDDNSFFEKARKSVIISLFARYIISIKNDVDMDWTITKDEFAKFSKSSWDDYAQVLSKYNYVSVVSNDILLFSNTVILLDAFEQAMSLGKVTKSHRITKVTDDVDLTDEEFKDKYKTVHRVDGGYIMSRIFNKDEFISFFINKSDEQEILYNENVTPFDFSVTTKKDTEIYKAQIRVFKEYKNVQKRTFVFSTSYNCPYCREEQVFDIYDYELESLTHLCPSYLNSKGDPKPVKFSKKQGEPKAYADTFIYGCDVICDGEVVVHNQKVYSFERLDMGMYDTNFVYFRRVFSYDDKEQKMILLASKKYYSNRSVEIIPTSNSHKIFDLIGSMNKYYRDLGFSFDNRGLLLQIATHLSCIMKVHFNYRKCHVSVVGSPSLSKTYPIKTATVFYDYMAQSFSRGTSVTVAGIQGGVTKSGVLETGIVTNFTFTLFDEADGNFFSDPLFAEILKSSDEEEITIGKIGGGVVKQNNTFFLASNKIPFHKQVPRIGTTIYNYNNTVVGHYKTLLKKISEEEREIIFDTLHGDSAMEIHQYIQTIDLTREFEYYRDELKNDVLMKAIMYARSEIQNGGIGWLNGMSSACWERVFFEFVCYDDNNEREMIVKPTSINNKVIYSLPVHNWNEAIKKYCKFPEEGFDIENPMSVKEADMKFSQLMVNCLKKIQDDSLVYKYITLYNIDNTRPVKHSAYKLAVLCTIQQGVTTEIDDNSYSLFKRLVFANKRGLSREEYDFKNGGYEPSEELLDMYIDIGKKISVIADDRRILEKFELSGKEQELSKALDKDKEEKDDERT